MYVKMKNGSYGHRVKTPDGHIHVIGKTRDDPPFEVDEETGAYLLELGVATAAEAPEVSGPPLDMPGENAAQRGAEGPELIPGYLDPAQLADMPMADLKAMARDMGIEFKGNISKAKLTGLISAQEVLVPAENPDTELEVEPYGEEPPVFDPGEAIS